MQSLNTIISHLRPSEINFVRHFYSYKRTKNFEKRGQLFELIVKGKAQTNEEGMRRLSGIASHSAFSQLKSQLKQEILDILVLHESTIKSTLSAGDAAFSARKSMLATEILYDRNLKSEAKEVEVGLLQDCLSQELFAETTILLSRRDSPIDVYLNPSLARKALADMTCQLENLDALYAGASAWFKCTFPPHLEHERQVAIASICAHTLPDLRVRMEQTNSIRLERYYHQLGFQCAFYHNELNAAKEHWCSLSVSVYKSNIPARNTKLYLHAYACLLLSASQELTEDSDELAWLRESFLTQNGVGLEVLEQLYFQARESEQLEVAALTADIVLEHEEVALSAPIVVRWTLYQAGVLFQLGDPHSCLRTLRTADASFRALPGALVASSILELMCMMELNEDSSIDNRFGAFERMVRRRGTKEPGINQDRVRIIVKVFRILMKYAGNFKLAMPELKEHLESLSETDSTLRWERYGLEVVPFHEWVAAAEVRVFGR